jgi:cytochrome c553
MLRALARLALVLPFAAPAAWAAEGNVEDGKVKVYTCTGCHGIPNYKNIYPHYSVPKIHNQNYAYLVAALTSYKNGERTHPTMRAQGESMTEQDIADIAAYLSQPSPADAEAAE